MEALVLQCQFHRFVIAVFSVKRDIYFIEGKNPPFLDDEKVTGHFVAGPDAPPFGSVVHNLHIYALC